VEGGKEGDVGGGGEGTERKKGRGRWDGVGKMEAKEGSGEAKGKERGTGHGEGGKGKERNMKNIKYTPPTWGGLAPLLGKEDGGRGLSVEFAVYQEAGRGAEEGGEGKRGGGGGGGGEDTRAHISILMQLKNTPRIEARRSLKTRTNALVF